MATKTKFNNEIKIALSFIVSLTILIVGINFLKGINVFTPSNHYFLKFEKIEGLVISNGVFIKGYKVGQIRDIEYDFTDEHTPFLINFAINEDINIPEGTIAYLFDESLMGGKGINIVLGKDSNSYSSGDTLVSDVQEGLLASMGEMVPQLQSTIGKLDSLIYSVNTLVNSEDIDNSLKNMSSITANLDLTTQNLNGIIKNDIPSFLNKANTLADNLNEVSVNLTKVQFEDISIKVDSTLKNISAFTNKLNSPNSSLGLLMNDKALYNNLQSTANSANSLLIDLKENPKRYVHFSLWGRKEKKEKTKK